MTGTQRNRIEQALVEHRELEDLVRVECALGGIDGEFPGTGHVEAGDGGLVVAIALGAELHGGLAHVHERHAEHAGELSVLYRLTPGVRDMNRKRHGMDHAGMVGRDRQIEFPAAVGRLGG